ncbi:hypothetical protein NSK_002952 [Nannochloropsis salina CCMP1776]|uniref:Uncharacterized protein n=1 Tax=Nannochloropsis salina CCMP1776 TaxID=1027361 RepID=A0A4D9D1L9_9STRA|nr:hypothetical protein NSK_002952 [Nannochloropsis salina CCMP1776]|eukprot:TFJ85442.1 hypothetical protein NSK_002952 [Nannochloropsis salina CCMP1776]
MPPKAKANKKTDTKRAEKLIEDKTFGLKNKNKSKKVQQYVQAVTTQTKHNIGVKTEAEKAAAAKAKKEAKEKEDVELKLLFMQMQAGAGKTSKAMEAAAEAQKAKREAAMKAKGGQGAAQWIEIDMTGKPLEEVIEYERQKLAFFKKNVTPVTVSPNGGRTGGRGETQG